MSTGPGVDPAGGGPTAVLDGGQADDAGSAAAAPPGGTEVAEHRRPEPGLADVAVAAAALLLFIANYPGLYRGSPVLLGVVALPLGAAGLVSLGVLAVRGDVAARFAAAFLAWAGIATLLSDEPALAWNAGWGGDRGWLYFAAYVGCWAIGRRRGQAGVDLISRAFVLGLSCNIVLAFGQALVPADEGLVTLYEGRAMGFPLNPVLLGAYMAGGAALAAKRVADAGDRWWGWVALVLACATVGNMAGSRVALAAIVVLPLVASWRGRRSALRTGAVAAAVVVGLGLGTLVLSGAATGRATSVDSAGSGITSRAAVWRAGAGAVVERPVFGWGPNHFRSATTTRVSSDVARIEGDDKSFVDAHNVVVELVVTTGIPGLVLAAGFAWAAVRRSRGPLAWYALGVSITWLLEPFAVSTVASAMLALGLAAVAAGAEPDPPPRRTGIRVAGIAAATLLALGAGAIAARQVRADQILAQVRGKDDQSAVTGRADRALPRDPGIHTIHTRMLQQEGLVYPERHLGPAALRAGREGVDIDPHSYIAWFDLGVSQQRFSPGERPQRDATARAAFLRAHELNPWAISPLRSLYAIDHDAGRTAAAARWRASLCELDACPKP